MKPSAVAATLALCTALTAVGPAFAQDALPLRITAADGGLPSGATTSTAVFRAEALRSDALTLAASRLALTRSKDPQVLDHARRVIANREATTAALLPTETLAGGPLEAVTAATSATGRIALGPVGQATIDRLRGARDEASFNRAYAAEQARTDARTLALYDGFYRNGDTEQGRRFAYEALPWIESERARSTALQALYGS